MEMSSEEIVKLIERVSGIPEILEKKEELSSLINKFEKVESYLSRFGSLEELTGHLQEIENKIFLCKTYLTTNEAAAYVSMSKFTLLEAAKRGEIPYYTPPSKSFYFTKEELDKWLHSFRVPSRDDMLADLDDSLPRKRNNRAWMYEEG